MNAASREWSPYQTRFFDWVKTGRGSAVVLAVAGAGKTTVLVEGSRHMRGSIASAMYNKSAATEFQSRLAKAGFGTNSHRAGTFHSFGYSALRRVYDRAKLDERAKTDRLVKECKVQAHLHSFSTKLVSLAKNAAVGLYSNASDEGAWWDIVAHHDLDSDLEDPEQAKEGVAAARRMLKLSCDIAHELIDFDDMIYLPVVHRGMRVWQNDWLLVDEAQDTNPARRALARKMLRPGGRAVFVGDPAQAIYGFTGADNDSLDQIKRDFGAVELPLTISYRCPRAVVGEARLLVSHIEASPTAAEGEVRHIHEDDLTATGEPEALTAADAILCRKTAPLVSLAFWLIKHGTPCHVEGREIGAGLLALAGRWKVKSVTALVDRLNEYRERETAKLMAKGAEARAAALDDKVETLLVLAEGYPDVECVVQKVKELFADGAPTLTLSTVHKAKGREWKRVYLLGRHEFMPSPWARQAWQQDQERNLIYVAMTRAQGTLTYVTARREP